MRTSGTVLGISLGALFAAIGGCQTSERHRATVAGDAESAQVQRGSPTFTVGWAQLRRGLTADQVLNLLGHPQDIKVTTITTHWYYSDQGAKGPYVAFDTRPMQVSHWRSP